eukprot:TRINITY_DN904_c0_g2_i3.p1 TRINITY_DN904_c0_g2~~TRINITY_DN904_c0_g2_i3.p1  ORF type:complete len:276 (+),score=66.52 TRINITY_DN904_c0_g2_i3:49-828(+)
MVKVEKFLQAKQKKGKHTRWDHNSSALSDWSKGEGKRKIKRTKAEEELEAEGLNAKLDKQMTDVYKRLEELDEENWTKKMKKDRWEAEFCRLGGIPLKRNKCSFKKHLERVKNEQAETQQKIALEEETGLYDLVEGSKVKERRRKGMLKRTELLVKNKRQAAKDGYIHRTALGADKRGEIVLDQKKVKQMEIRALKRRSEGSSKGRASNRGSMWDDKYDINKFNDPKALASGGLDKIGSNRRKGGRAVGRKKAPKKRRR